MKYPTLQKVMLLTVALVASLALNAQAGRPTLTSAKNAQQHAAPSARDVFAPPKPQLPTVTLYDQYDNASGVATLSATFTDFIDFGADDADDFVVPSGETWTVESIDADGVYFNGFGPATDWNVFIYTDAGGLPGGIVSSQMNMPISVSGTTFTFNLSPSVVLTAGHYWIEIQANMTFGTEGEWGWTDRTVQSNSPAAWQNPGGGFGICPSWTAKLVCVPTGGGPDNVYRINGTTGTGTPTPTPTPTATPSCTPIVVNGSIDNSDPAQTDRLFRSGIAQTCPASTACAIFGDPTPHHYDSYSFTNSSGSTQCVLVDTNTACTGTNFIFTAAYLGSFDPNNLCTNWIGDSGSSPNPDQAFSVDVPDGQTLVLVVSEVTPSAGCSGYTVTVTGLCSGGGGGGPTLLSAASRKTHGPRGDFDIDLPSDGSGIECRTGQTRYAVVFTFDNAITSVGSATTSCGTIGSTTIVGSQVITTFNGSACNKSNVTVTLSDVADAGGTLASASASMGILIGDAIANGFVNNADIGNVQNNTGPTTAANFRDDITADGRVNNQDIQGARSHRGDTLP